jgi:CubicO group peptidase (beta-lactamase class C family)
MKSWIKRVLLVLGAAILLLLAYGGYRLYQFSKTWPIGAGLAAKILCSSVFLSARAPEDVLQEELADMAGFLRTDVDYERKQVEAALGPVKRRAIYREGLGCTLVANDGQAVGAPIAAEAVSLPDAPWPEGDLVLLDDVPPEVDQAGLAAALDSAFAEPDPDRLRKTRAVVVVYDGRIIAERHADGFSADTPMHSWSMAKSVTSALVGIVVGQGKLSLEEPASVPEWSDPSDPRRDITLDQLLRMSSGLEFGEGYGTSTSDVSIMLFNSRDMAAFAASKPLEAEPDSVWHYSSGTTNIMCRMIRDAVGGPHQEYLEFPRRALFDRIGMRSAVFEPDASGTLVGSSHVYASPRDWARFGLLYLQDGVWQGERILPEGWVAYSSTPSPTAPLGRYGAHFYTNPADAAERTDRTWPDLPEFYYASGLEGQKVVIIPSHNLVIVRLGYTEDPEAWDMGALVGDVLKAVPSTSTARQGTDGPSTSRITM